ncbi:sulfatase modifying factor 1 (C-alpha-formyglycine- generating enzyme 1) [Arthrobacter sp. W1]|nr:sulfatase modifying factor 1 (C-alpha-formyglycine- generating enzyme 1) [Arthrobacter sp. W1]
MGCCTPGREPGNERPAAAAGRPSVAPAGLPGPGHDLAQVQLPAGSFAMGDHFNEGYAGDGEVPVHRVELDAFSMDATTVTNRAFARFVESTGYRTESERLGYSAVFHAYIAAPAGDIMPPAAGTPWWHGVRGASWRHPAGRHSSWEQLPEHPVVQVSHDDALAYCRWAGRALPTEAQWEYAARGGLDGARYAWGNELVPGGIHQCNIWQGDFPAANTLEDGYLGTAPVGSFPANPAGLYDMAGNVWQWCSDWFLPKYYRNSPAANPQGPSIGQGRVMRGGSHLCHDSYCHRYRVAARSHAPADSASSNTGFRTVGR